MSVPSVRIMPGKYRTQWVRTMLSAVASHRFLSTRTRYTVHGTRHTVHGTATVTTDYARSHVTRVTDHITYRSFITSVIGDQLYPSWAARCGWPTAIPPPCSHQCRAGGRYDVSVGARRGAGADLCLRSFHPLPSPHPGRRRGSSGFGSRLDGPGPIGRCRRRQYLLSAGGAEGDPRPAGDSATHTRRSQRRRQDRHQHTDRHTGRQADRQAGRQAGRQTGRQTGGAVSTLMPVGHHAVSAVLNSSGMYFASMKY